ncbi:hypothetical protein [Mucilaginibacter psychrotolerans]|uniref:hypothetical protein n=1 Tax=Mucilaginibacter psychrotolerans TaxID=1524096 RepID=UPI00130518D5|nr:hypothetical protein [Mucilaginibacter psychrotolerans]
MSTKTHTTPKKQKESPVNPFIQMIEDKKRIDKATEEGKPLSTLKGINFVKPV